MNYMGIETIRSSINALKKTCATTIGNESLQARIIHAYTNRIIETLEKILSKNNQNLKILTEKLNSFLNQNWEFVRASPLCYTALPQKEVTHLLCDIAQYVAESNVGEVQKQAAIQILMPGVICKSMNDNYPDLDTIDLRIVIKTHVLGQQPIYLIPVKLLTQIDLDWWYDDKALGNVYYDYTNYSKEGTLGYLSQLEKNRLLEHSIHTKAIGGILHTYQFFINEEASLFSQLKLLINALYTNGDKRIGTSTQAGRGVYPVIVEFMKYWEIIKSNRAIPKSIKNQIKRLMTLGSDIDIHDRNILETCLSTRADQLKTITDAHEKILLNIRIDKKTQTNKLSQLKVDFEIKKNQLKTALKTGEYLGKDTYGITAKLLQNLKIKLELQGSFDLLTSVVKGLTAREVFALCCLEEAPKEITRAIANLENLVIFLTDILNKEALSDFLSKIKNEISLIIKSYTDLLALLGTLDAEKSELVCKFLSEELIKVIKYSKDFADIFTSLEFEKKTPFFQVCKEKLPSLIQNSYDFSIVYEVLYPEQRLLVYETIKERLPLFIKKASDFYYVLNFLNSEQRDAIYQITKERLPSFVEDIESFSDILKVINPEQCLALCKVIKNNLPSIIVSRADLSKVKQHLSHEKWLSLGTHLEEHLYLKNKFPKVFGFFSGNQSRSGEQSTDLNLRMKSYK